jgi:hypothetical protein
VASAAYTTEAIDDPAADVTSMASVVAESRLFSLQIEREAMKEVETCHER